MSHSEAQTTIETMSKKSAQEIAAYLAKNPTHISDFLHNSDIRKKLMSDEKAKEQVELLLLEQQVENVENNMQQCINHIGKVPQQGDIPSEILLSVYAPPEDKARLNQTFPIIDALNEKLLPIDALERESLQGKQAINLGGGSEPVSYCMYSDLPKGVTPFSRFPLMGMTSPGFYVDNVDQISGMKEPQKYLEAENKYMQQIISYAEGQPYAKKVFVIFGDLSDNENGEWYWSDTPPAMNKQITYQKVPGTTIAHKTLTVQELQNRGITAKSDFDVYYVPAKSVHEMNLNSDGFKLLHTVYSGKNRYTMQHCKQAIDRAGFGLFTYTILQNEDGIFFNSVENTNEQLKKQYIELQLERSPNVLRKQQDFEQGLRLAHVFRTISVESKYEKKAETVNIDISSLKEIRDDLPKKLQAIATLIEKELDPQKQIILKNLQRATQCRMKAEHAFQAHSKYCFVKAELMAMDLIKLIEDGYVQDMRSRVMKVAKDAPEKTQTLQQYWINVATQEGFVKESWFTELLALCVELSNLREQLEKKLKALQENTNLSSEEKQKAIKQVLQEAEKAISTAEVKKVSLLNMLEKLLPLHTPMPQTLAREVQALEQTLSKFIVTDIYPSLKTMANAINNHQLVTDIENQQIIRYTDGALTTKQLKTVLDIEANCNPLFIHTTTSLNKMDGIANINEVCKKQAGKFRPFRSKQLQNFYENYADSENTVLARATLIKLHEQLNEHHSQLHQPPLYVIEMNALYEKASKGQITWKQALQKTEVMLHHVYNVHANSTGSHETGHRVSGYILFENKPEINIPSEIEQGLKTINNARDRRMVIGFRDRQSNVDATFNMLKTFSEEGNVFRDALVVLTGKRWPSVLNSAMQQLEIFSKQLNENQFQNLNTADKLQFIRYVSYTLFETTQNIPLGSRNRSDVYNSLLTIVGALEGIPKASEAEIRQNVESRMRSEHNVRADEVKRVEDKHNIEIPVAERGACLS